MNVGRKMDQKTRKLMTMHLALHHGDDMDTLNVSKRGRRLTSTEDSIDASIQRLEEDIKSAEDN